MEIRPLTVFAILFVLVLLILPVFFVNIEPEQKNGSVDDELPSNAPHPHKMSPEMQKEYDRMRAENRNPGPPKDQPANQPARPANEPTPVE